MKDIKLLETCPYCGVHITLMLSVNTDTDRLMAVKRCLKCGNYPVTEVVEVTETEIYKDDGSEC